jgi:DNA-binding response OmpR family regulator
LIVEPNEDLRELMALAAGRECPVRACDAGERGLRMLLDEPPAVLVAEVDLPGLTGEQLAVRARLLPDPPLIVLIGADHERLERARSYADRTLRKPFDMACLEKVVGEGCAAAREAQAALPVRRP